MPGEVATQVEVLRQDLASAQAHITELKQSLEESRDEVQQMDHENASLNVLVAELQGNAPGTAAQTHHPSRDFMNETAVNQIADAVLNTVKQRRIERFGGHAMIASWFDQHHDRLKLVIATIVALIASGRGSDANRDQLLSRALAQIESATRNECKLRLYAVADLVGWAEVNPTMLGEITQVTARIVQDMQTQEKI
jgi:regulator of replication initiation timing